MKGKRKLNNILQMPIQHMIISLYRSIMGDASCNTVANGSANTRAFHTKMTVLRRIMPKTAHYCDVYGLVRI